MFDATHAGHRRAGGGGPGRRAAGGPSRTGWPTRAATCDRLASATGGAWVVVEKILEAGEALPADWACAGTTGYDALRLVDGLFLDPAGGDALSAEYARLCRRRGRRHPAAKRFADVAERRQARDRRRVARRRGDRGWPACSAALSPDVTEDDARHGANRGARRLPRLPRVRAPGRAPVRGRRRRRSGDAVEGARRALPQRLRGLAADLGAAALGKRRPVSGAAGRAGEFAVRFQQTTGPVQAKGVEDTACYRWSRLVSLNEVGGDPDRFGVHAGGVPRGGGAAGGRLAGHHDHAVHARHQAPGGRQGQARRARRDARSEWGQQVRQWHERAVHRVSGGDAGPPSTRTPSTCCGRPWWGRGRSAANGWPAT